jgi:Arc/MetJ family transcription regulator
MFRRTTIELDEELVAEAMAVLDQPTVRATVEEALRRAIASARSTDRQRRAAQIDALQRAARLIDEDTLRGGAWR